MNLLYKFFAFLKKYKYTIAVFIYFQAIVYFQILIWHQGSYLFYFINAFSLILILHIISKSKFILSIILLVIFSLLITFEAYYGFFFKSNITLGIVFSIMETNVAEAAGVMKGRIVPCVIIFCLSFFGIFKSTRELKNLNINVKWSILLLSGYLFVCIPLYVLRKIKIDDEFADAFKTFPVLWSQKTITERFPLLYGQLSSVVVYVDEKNKMKNYASQDRILPEGVFWNDTTEIPEKIFFIVGESQYRKHLSLYGYDIKTTPFADSLFQTSTGMTVYNGLAPACFTTYAMRMLLTFATPQDVNSLNNQKNIIELANDAGYQTVWLSNQPTFGPWDDGFVWQVSSLSHDVYYTGNRYERTIFTDLVLITELQKRYKKNMKQFFFIHLDGSHWNYADRYDEIDKTAINGDDITTHYDRSIHHTDRVLREIYNIMKDDASSVLYYISDHGENVELGAHGIVNGGFCQYDVPMFLINQSKIDVDAIVNKYFLHDKNRINTLSSTNILAELMGYSFSDEMISKEREQSYYVHDPSERSSKFYELYDVSE